MEMGLSVKEDITRDEAMGLVIALQKGLGNESETTLEMSLEMVLKKRLVIVRVVGLVVGLKIELEMVIQKG